MMGTPILPGFQAGGAKTWRELRVVPGMVLCALLSAPWFVYISW